MLLLNVYLASLLGRVILSALRTLVEQRGDDRVVLRNVLGETVLSGTDKAALRTLLRARVHRLRVVHQVIFPSEGFITKLALESFLAVHALDVGVQPPRGGQGVAALAADVPPVGGQVGVLDGSLFAGRRGAIDGGRRGQSAFSGGGRGQRRRGHVIHSHLRVIPLYITPFIK